MGPKKDKSSSSSSGGSAEKPLSAYRIFYTRRSAELKAADPDAKGVRDQVNAEWKNSPENPNRG